jgi:deoxyadenosine/deoxycytidine kinase
VTSLEALKPGNDINYLAIAGNIGAGKSTLTRLLSDHFKWTPYYESVEDNPYLEDFYEDMKRWSFNLQIYFLSSRFQNQVDILKGGRNFIQDRTIYEDVEIFAKNLFEMGLMEKRDYDNYSALFRVLVQFIRPPDLLIYLRADVSTLVRQITSRGREFEKDIRIDYLERLNRHYETFVENYPYEKLIIETDNLDFVKNPEDLGRIINMIEARKFGLFS